jgi:hypothetical protein
MALWRKVTGMEPERGLRRVPVISVAPEGFVVSGALAQLLRRETGVAPHLSDHVRLVGKPGPVVGGLRRNPPYVSASRG